MIGVMPAHCSTQCVEPRQRVRPACPGLLARPSSVISPPCLNAMPTSLRAHLPYPSQVIQGLEEVLIGMKPGGEGAGWQSKEKDQ